MSQLHLFLYTLEYLLHLFRKRIRFLFHISRILTNIIDMARDKLMNSLRTQ